MFGQNSAWGQQNNQQQQQQQPQQTQGLFGSTSTFGQNTGGFGQPAQTGFGQPAQAQPSTSLFGAQPSTTFGELDYEMRCAGLTRFPGRQVDSGLASLPARLELDPKHPDLERVEHRLVEIVSGSIRAGLTGAAGGSLFGSSSNTNTFGGNSGATFGSNNNTSGGLFGKPATPTSTFGSGATSNLFGAKAASPFGASSSNNTVNILNTNAPLPPIPTTGSANPVYQPTWQQDPSAAPGKSDAPPHLFHVISAMNEYRGASYEELRAMDYQQNRKDAGAQPPSGFGQASTGFGQPAATGFGQPASTSPFGAPKPGQFGATSSGFGGSSSGFGATNTNTSGGLFGQPQQQQPTQFGQSSTSGGLFGQQPAQAQPTTGLFGSTPTSTFGQPAQPAQPATSTFGGFGATKPAFGATSTGFGQPAAPATNTFGQPSNGSTFGGFGQPAQPQQQQQPAGGLFGGGFGSTPQATGTSLFGQPQQQPAQPAGGMFGSTAPKPGGLFGSTPAAAPLFGGFGQTQPAAPATSNLFGSTNNNTANSGSLFGQPQQNQPAPANNSLFGNTGGSSMFGAKPAAPATGGLFGQAPAQPAAPSTFSGFGQNNSGGLFGSTNNQTKPAGTGMFGGSLFNNATQPQQPAGGGLFGNFNQSQPASSSLFSGTQPQQNTALGGSFGGFGQSTNQQPQAALTASIDQNPYGNNQLFAYNGQKLEYGSQNKKPALPPLSTSTSFGAVPKSKISKLRGFSSPLTPTSTPVRSASPLNFSQNDRYKGLTDAALSPNAFIPRQSVKKLNLTPKTSLPNGEDHLESVLGKSALRSSTSVNGNATPDRNGQQSPVPLAYNPPAEARQIEDTPSRQPPRQVEVSKKGDYWCRPRLEKLKGMRDEDLAQVENFTAGRRGYGEVTFLEPVDLTSVSLQDMLGTIIVFQDLELSVYPDDRDKAERGEGLNVPAKITLEHCFAKDKATKQYITDSSDARYSRHLKRVKNIPETEFISFTDDGVWTFKVEHFSRYGLVGSDDEEYSEEEERMQKDARSESEDEEFLPPTKSMHDQDGSGSESGSHDSGIEEDEEDEVDDTESETETESMEIAEEKVPQWDLKSKVGSEGLRKIREMQSSFFGETRSQAKPLPLKVAQAEKVKRMLEDEGFGLAEEEITLDRAVKRASFGEDTAEKPRWRQPRNTSDPAPTVSIESVDLLADDRKTEASKASCLLNLHLSHTVIETVDSVPYATLSSEIRFRDFAGLFETTNTSHEANIFRLGQALFDEIGLHLPPTADDEQVKRISAIRRKLALSEWLQGAVAPAVDSDLLNTPNKVFTLLSGNQVDRAVQAALDGNDMRLATLIAQIGGPEAFRNEIKNQLADWEKYKCSNMIGNEYQKLYHLLAGFIDDSVKDGLDWKRVLGLYLWFGNSFEDSIGDALVEIKNPLPPFLEKASSLKWNLHESTDIIFDLIRLYSDSTISLDEILVSKDTSSSPLDNRLIWHLLFLLCKVLRKRDFQDRDTEGYSGTEDLVTASYASQLEVGGEWLWAAFVLCHLERIEGREKGLRELLGRHADSTSEEEKFLVETLQVPAEWIHEAKAAALASSGDAFREYHELLRAGLFEKAHKILIEKLAPEAVIRNDLVLLRRLCEPLEGRDPQGWEFGGKLFLTFANLLEEAPRLLHSVVAAGSHPDPTQAAALSTLAKSLPRVLTLLPALFPDKEDVMQIAGLSDMLSGLHQLAGPLHSAGLIPRPPVPPLLVDQDRLHLLQSAAFESFETSLAAISA
ncbi:nuclear pore complex protein Nup98-Nup96, partial [Tremellales sp. Uapishka_1]